MKTFLALLSLLVSLNVFGASIAFENGTYKPIEIKPEASTGLDAIYVLRSAAGVQMVYTASSATSTLSWQRFSNLGSAYAEDIAFSRNGSKVTAACQASDMGYVIEDGGRRFCFWVVDYASHALDLGSIAPAAEQDCGRTLLNFTGSAGDVPYFTINGRRMVLSRDLQIEYSTLVFDEESFVYSQRTVTETVPSIEHTVSVPAPLCNTDFRLHGDRFLQAWGEGQSIVSTSFDTGTVEAHTRATQTLREVDNEQKDPVEGLGGSAPCEIRFEAAVSDAAIFREWQISRSPEFDIIENSFTELDLTYTFTEQGTTYVRFSANNAAGTCPFDGTVYEVMIGESRLDIPNAFSPEGSPGVNDEWRVSYKSLVSYECHIFNRWGKKLFSNTDPAEGWNGKIGNKTVPAGVYFYVIKAKGADGIVYEKAGDINVINYNAQPGASQPDAEE